MTASDFNSWRSHLNITRAEAAKRLGCSVNTITAYEQGRNAVPRYVALACSAVALGLPPWPAA